jgi:Matrixin.
MSHRCGCTDAQLALYQNIRWSDKHFTWALGAAARSFGPLSPELVAQACAAWARVCGATFAEADEDSAEIVILVGRGRRAGFDDPRVLAWCEVGPQRDQAGRPRATQLMVNTAIDWDQINLGTVLKHELGHGLCFKHEPEDSDSIMAPAINRNINDPRPVDVQHAQQRYGEPAPKPLTPDPTTPGTKQRIRSSCKTADGRLWVGDLYEVTS